MAEADLAATLAQTLRSTDAIMSATLDGVVTTWNAAAERLYGWTADEAVGRYFSIVVPPDRTAELTDILIAVRAGAPAGPFQTVRTHKSGERLNVIVKLAPLRDSQGTVVAVGASARAAYIEDAEIPPALLLALTADRHRLVVEAIPHIVWIAGRHGLTEYLNRVGAERLGITPEAIYGWNWLRLVHPDDVENARTRWEAAIRDGGEYVNEYRMRHRDGSYHWYLARAVGLPGLDGTISEWVGTWTDVDDRKRAEERRAGDARLLAQVRDSVIVTDTAGVVTYWNDGATHLLGWTAAEMIGQPLAKRFPESVRADISAMTARIAAGTEFAGEFEDYHKNGSRVWIDARVRAITDASGAVIGVMGVSHDITARKRAEEQRDRLFARLQSHVERLPLGYLEFGADGRIVEWNSAAERIFGYTKEEALGWLPPYEAIMSAEAWADVSRVMSRLRAGDMSAHSINTNRTKDGRTITCEWSNTPFFDAGGSFLGLVSLAQDITSREADQAALRSSEERFRQITESISEVFWLIPVGRHEIAYISPAFEEIWGRTCDALLANPDVWIDAVHPDDRDRVAHAAQNNQLSGDYDEEYRIVRPDGTIRWIRDRAFPVRDSNNAVVYVTGVAEDITARRQLEEQLRQSQKMEAIGQLAGGVAHDFNNLLTVIGGNGELLLRSLGASDSRRDLAEEIVRAGERSASLTRQLLAFSRKQVLALKIVDLNAIVLDTERMLRRVIGEDIELTTNLQRALPPVKADPGQLEQILLNLAVNARDAMPQGGRLAISTTSSNSHLMLEVADTGAGMTEEVRQRVFEPFFTTKPLGKGTGLGLAVVHGFVAQSGGHIDVDSEPSKGTTFRISLPIAPQPVVAAAAKTGTSLLATGSETILVVEDEEGVRTLTTRVLRSAGYTVLQAASGPEAFRIAEEHQGKIDLVITDVVMPGTGGRVVADQLLAVRPGIKIVYVSGYTDDDVMRRGVEFEREHFLPKPFSPAVLTKKIREVLEAPE